MAKAKYIMYVNVGELPRKKADEYIDSVKDSTKDLREDGTLWAYVGVRHEPTRIEALPIV